MVSLFLIGLFGIPLIWILAIRPYCVAKKENYHIGASFGRAI